MPGRILIADPIATNRIMLKVTLRDAFYDVALVASGRDLLDHLKRHPCDLLIASYELSDMTGAELCEALRASRAHAALPVILICNNPLQGACCDALAAGADDCISRPVEDTVLLARMRSLMRARDADAELRLREDTRRALGLAEDQADFVAPARVVFVAASHDDTLWSAMATLEHRLTGRFSQMPPQTAMRQADGATDVFVIMESAGGSGETLSLLTELRANTATRHAAVLYIAESYANSVAATALDLGANDLMAKGFHLDELTIRLQRQIARKRTADRLRANMQVGLRARR